MNELTLGNYTDMIFHSNSASITRKEFYTVIKTPGNPYYYFGNYLIFHDALDRYSLETIESIFAEEFSSDSRIGHVAFSWPYNDSDLIDQYMSSGYIYDKNLVMSLTERKDLNIPLHVSHLTIRQFEDGDWEQWMLLELEEIDDCSKSQHELFLRGLQRDYQHLIENRLGAWYGAYIDNQLVASAGIFYESNIGRFQRIRTKPSYRGLGICKTLMYKICSDYCHLNTIVVVADTAYYAKKIYADLGFKDAGYQVSLYKIAV